ncbi:MAG: hypothetical protein ACI7YS_08370 [Flavobacterium sp.]
MITKTPNKIKLVILLILISQVCELLDDYLRDNISLPIGSNFIVITLPFYMFLAYNIINRQKWARIILLICYSVEILLFIRSLYKVGFEIMSLGDVRIMIISILKQILQVSALIILFSGASKKWFNIESDEPPGTIKNFL